VARSVEAGRDEKKVREERRGEESGEWALKGRYRREGEGRGGNRSSVAYGNRDDRKPDGPVLRVSL